jgi:phosphatidylinositol dimannoside acyltransferase
MTEARPGRTLGQRLRARALLAASWLACRLPETPLLAIADFAGSLSYRLATERRRRARRNLLRITRWLAARGTGPEAARAAATDPRALAELVRAAFRNQARYYVQLARAPIVDRAYLDRWLVIENAGEVDAILTGPGGKLFVGMHMSWFELPALIAAHRSGRPAVADAELQAYMVRTRQKLGLHLIELGGAKRQLREALERGETVGLLGDRDITGGGIETELFGARAPLAAGPALLALETGVTPHIFGVWRDETGVYRGRAEAVPFPAEGTRRERVTAWLEEAAKAFERHIAVAPEQWLAVFHPIWPDLEGERARGGRRAGANGAPEGDATGRDAAQTPDPLGIGAAAEIAR